MPHKTSGNWGRTAHGMFQRYGAPAAYTYSTETKIWTDFCLWVDVSRFVITHVSEENVHLHEKWQNWPKSPADQVFRQTPGDWEEGFGCKLLLGDGRNSSSFPRWSTLQCLGIPAEEYPSLPWGPKYLPRLPWNSAQDDASKWTMAIGNWYPAYCNQTFLVQHVCKKNIEVSFRRIGHCQCSKSYQVFSRRGHSLLSNGPGLLMVVNLTYLMDGSDDLRS